MSLRGGTSTNTASSDRLPSPMRQSSYSTTGGIPRLRPEARRAYADEVSNGMHKEEYNNAAQRDNSTLLLQQAANYASLASPFDPNAHSSVVLPHGVESGTHPALDSVQTASVPKRRLSRTHRNGRSRNTPSCSLNINDADDVEEDNPPRLSISSAESSGGSEVKTPESSNAPPPAWVDSEEFTGEDKQEKNEERRYLELVQQQQQQQRQQQQHQQQQQYKIPPLQPSSPPILDLSAGLAEAGLYQAAVSTHRQNNRTLMKAALEMGQEQSDAADCQDAEEQEEEQEEREALRGSEDERRSASQSTTSFSLTAQSRASTIRAKRPSTLLRLPSARTDETARPSPPSTSSVPSTAGVTPAARPCDSYSQARDPMERATVTKSGQGRLSSYDRDQADTDSSADSVSETGLPAAASSTGSISEDDDAAAAAAAAASATLHGLRSSRARVASPDSWRSLLPEHDPFFIPSESVGTSSRAPSLAGGMGLSQRLSFSSNNGHGQESSGSQSGSQADNCGEKDKRRMSSESVQSSFSLPGPTAASIYASSNASGSLYDLDGSFNTSGSRAAFAPLQYQYNHSSRSLASPLLQSKVFESDASSRSNTTDERLDSKLNKTNLALQTASRRHASFSAFDSPSSDSSQQCGKQLHSPPPALNNGSLQQQVYNHPDHFDRSRVNEARLYNPLTATLLSSSPEKRGAATNLGSCHGGKSSLPSGMSPSSPAASSCAMGNEGDRESWPSSRNSLQGWQVGQGNSNRNSIQVFDPHSVDQRLADGMQQSSLGVQVGAIMDPLPGVLSTETSTTESATTIPPADAQLHHQYHRSEQHRLLTTTTTTTLTTTTTTLVPSSAGLATKPMASYAAAAPLAIDPKTGKHSIQAAAAAAPPSRPVGGKADAPYDVSPLSPSSLPFLETRPAPASTDFNIETHPSHYTLKTKLPGFGIDGITLATKHHRQLVIVADKWEESNGGHFERRITFGPDADLRATRANFDGTLLKITVPRRM